jgi:RNase H domain-containing protein/argonaute-like protein/MID domain-containing protein
MTTRETALQPLAWKLDHIPEEIPPVFGLPLPDEVRTRMRALSPNGKLPEIHKLYHVLRALDAGIIDITTGSFSFDPNKRPPYWMLNSTRAKLLDSTRLVQALAAWGITLYPGAGHRFAEALTPSAFAWQQVHLGTAPQQLAQKLLPSLYTHLLLETNTPIVLSDRDGTTYHWQLRRAPSIDPYTAELVSYPPDLYYGKFPFVYSLKFSIGTMPGTSSLFLTCRPGVRRLVGWPLLTEKGYLHLRFGYEKRVFFSRRGESWLSHERAENYLVPLAITRYKEAEWVAHAPVIFEQLGVHERFPDLMMLLRTPTGFLPEIMISYDASLSTKTRVLGGVESKDYAEIYDQLSEPLAYYGAKPLPPYPKAYFTLPARAETSYNASDQRERDVPASVRQRAAHNIQLPVEINIMSDDAEYWQEELLHELGYTSEEEHPDHSIHLNRFEYNLAAQLPEAATNDKDAELGANHERMREIAKLIPLPVGRNAGLLIEMHDYSHEFYRKGSRETMRDPKQATRIGLAQIGYKTQFIRPLDDDPGDYKSRVKSGVRDLLRQLGYRWNALYPGYQHTSLPPAGEFDILACWVIRTAKRKGHRQTEASGRLPLLAYAPGNERQVYVCLPNERGPQWVPYSDAPLLMQTLSERSMENEEMRLFFQNALRDLKLERDGLLLLHEQKLRSVFPELLDGHIVSFDLKSVFALGTRPIRIARIAYSGDGTVPETYPAYNPGGTATGIFFAPIPNMFYSTQTKPGTADKIKDRRHRDPGAPGHPSWNPTTLEIYLCGLLPEDKAEEWALLTHRLREEAYNTDKATLLPEPLHSFKLLSEYVPRFREEVEVE